MVTLITNTLTLPEETADYIGCASGPSATHFTDPALDINSERYLVHDSNNTLIGTFDKWTIAKQAATEIGGTLTIDDREPAQLDDRELRERIEARTEAEQQALRICNSCPALESCREWALNNDVFGVAGGLTQTQRTTITTKIRARRGNTDRDLRIAALIDAGLSNKEMAQKLGCSERSAARYRAQLKGKNMTHAPEEENITWEEAHEVLMRSKTPDLKDHAREYSREVRYQATGSFQASRVTPETAAMLDLLLDGREHDREEVIATIASSVDDEMARKSIRNPENRENPSEQHMNQARRRVALNRLHILTRRGRVIETKQGSSTTYSMETRTGYQWAAFRDTTYATTAQTIDNSPTLSIVA